MPGSSLFVGRVRELAELQGFLRSGASLVTLWGPGGAGKTRLAREQAAAAQQDGERVVWADLAGARSARDVLATLASALDVTLDARDARDDAEGAIARAASSQRAFLVADNLEQIDAAGRAVIVRLADAKGVRVLATSREPLGAVGERTVAVGPLAAEDAVALLGALSGTECDDTVAREIVSRLDALPLAIELAAARMPLLGGVVLLERVGQKLDVLRDTTRPERHATLRGAIAWSWDLLDLGERATLSACATFEAPFDALLVESMGLGDPVDVLDHLASLEKRALLRVEPAPAATRPAFRLYESVRDFARDAATDWEGLRERHARAVVERCEPLADDVRRGRATPDELVRRRADLTSVAARTETWPLLARRAVLTLAALLVTTGPLDELVDVVDTARREPSGDALLDARLAVAAADAHRAAGHLAPAERAANEALSLLELLETAAASAERRRIRAFAWRVAGSIARAKGDLPRALEDKERALEEYRALRDRAREGICVGELGAVLQSQGRLAAARDRHAEAIAILVAEKSRRAEGVERSFLAVATHRAGDPTAAVTLHESALAIHREVGHRRLEGAELLHLGFVFHELGDLQRSRAALDEARAVLASAGARGLEALALVFAARLDADEGELTNALLRLAEARTLIPRGWPRLAATLKVVEGHVAMARRDPGAARAAYESALATSTDVEVGFEAVTPAYFALACARLGDHEAASKSIATARTRAASSENPWLIVAIEVLAAGVHGSATRVNEEASTRSSEVRRALAFSGAPRSLRATGDASRVVLPDGRSIDLARRKNVRLVLQALLAARLERPSVAIDADALVAAGWPGEKMRADAATKRLHTAIWTLRSLGLEELLITSEEGYKLDPSVPFEQE